MDILRNADHGLNKLDFEGAIFPYGGNGFFDNIILIKFLIARFNKVAITYDLDGDAKIAKNLQSLGLKKGQNFFAVGIDKPGKRDVEGLLPDAVRGSVYGKYPNLVAVATSAEKEKQSAKQELKKHLLSEFKAQAKPGEEYFGEFYKLTKSLNKALK